MINRRITMVKHVDTRNNRRYVLSIHKLRRIFNDISQDTLSEQISLLTKAIDTIFELDIVKRHIFVIK